MSYELELISLRCNNTQEIKDEPYLTVNNYLEWGPLTLYTGAIEPINKRIGFDHNLSVELHESNPHNSREREDDYIGTMNLSQFEVESLASHPHPPQKYNFYGENQMSSGVSYTLIYDLHKI